MKSRVPVHERAVTPRWLRAVGLVAFALVLSIFAWWPALSAYPKAQGYDGIFIHQMLEAARVSMARWHELPLWNPYQCAGVPIWDNPQGMGTSPLFWPLAWLTDTTRAMELWYMLHSVAGFVSMWIFTRQEVGLSRSAAIVSSAMWAFCGAHIQHCTGGGFNWVPFFFLPLSIFLWRRAENDLRMAVGLGILASLSFWGGAAYPIAFVALILAAETLTRAWPPRRLLFIGRAALVAGAVTFGLSAARMLPVFDQVTHHTRDLGIETDAMQWTTLKDMFLSRTHSRYVPGQTYVWPEFGDYLGPFLFGLAILGILLSGARNAWVLALFVWSFLLMLGHEWPSAPWHILKGHVFPYKEMRVPSRFVIAVSSFLSVFAGIAVDKLGELANRWSPSRNTADAVRAAILAIGLVGAGDMISVGMDWTATCFNEAPLIKDVPVSDHFYLEGPGLTSFINQPQQNRGRLQCWEEWAFEQDAAVWTGDLPQARTSTPGSTVSNVSRTQNTFTFDIDGTAPAHVQLNSGFDRGWRASQGVAVRDVKLLAVDVPPGFHHVVVKYWPHGLTVGLWITGFSLIGVIAFFVWDGRRRRA
jgi:hypothetical protein